MSEDKDDVDLTPQLERSDYPPLLNALVPGLVLIVSIAYAWSLDGIVNPEMNLLLLRPLFVVIWVFLALIIIKDVIPSIRLHRVWMRQAKADRRPLAERFAPGTELGAGLVVAATFVFSFFGPGDGMVVFLISAFLYLAVASYLIGDRNPFRLVVQSAVFAGAIYLVMGVLLGVRL